MNPIVIQRNEETKRYIIKNTYSSEKIEEYEMMRAEILQYLREYQNVRNMMYIVTITVLGYCIGSKESNNSILGIYLYLMPLIVIIPSYIISVDYWKCVTKASTYLVIFHESMPGCPFKWETRNGRYSYFNSFMTGMNFQNIPYYICGGVCVLLYYANVYLSGISYVPALLGLFVTAICAFVFWKFRCVDREKLCDGWQKLREAERNQIRYRSSH